MKKNNSKMMQFFIIFALVFLLTSCSSKEVSQSESNMTELETSIVSNTVNDSSKIVTESISSFETSTSSKATTSLQSSTQIKSSTPTQSSSVSTTAPETTTTEVSTTETIHATTQVPPPEPPQYTEEIPPVIPEETLPPQTTTEEHITTQEQTTPKATTTKKETKPKPQTTSTTTQSNNDVVQPNIALYYIVTPNEYFDIFDSNCSDYKFKSISFTNVTPDIDIDYNLEDWSLSVCCYGNCEFDMIITLYNDIINDTIVYPPCHVIAESW